VGKRKDNLKVWASHKKTNKKRLVPPSHLFCHVLQGQAFWSRQEFFHTTASKSEWDEEQEGNWSERRLNVLFRRVGQPDAGQNEAQQNFFRVTVNVDAPIIYCLPLASNWPQMQYVPGRRHQHR
jgi:hypothetical protein